MINSVLKQVLRRTHGIPQNPQPHSQSLLERRTGPGRNRFARNVQRGHHAGPSQRDIRSDGPSVLQHSDGFLRIRLGTIVSLRPPQERRDLRGIHYQSRAIHSAVARLCAGHEGIGHRLRRRRSHARNGENFRADIVGLNINEYQIDKCKAYNEKAGLADRCQLVHGDYMDIPEQDGHFDAAYAIESIPHTSDKIGAFSEVLRVLKPGGVFGCYEYCLTPEFDADNAEHQRIKRGIEETTVSFTVSADVVTNALEAVGFEVIEAPRYRPRRRSANAVVQTAGRPRPRPQLEKPAQNQHRPQDNGNFRRVLGKS